MGSTYRGGKLLIDTYYQKLSEFLWMNWIRKNNSNYPATAKIIEDEIRIDGTHNHSSVKQKTKMIKSAVMEKALSSTDARPLRVLSDITAEVQKQEFGAAAMSALPKKESLLRSIRYNKQKIEVKERQLLMINTSASHM